MYRHYKNLKLYMIVNTCLIQEEGEWIQGILYKEVGGERLFVRSLVEFELKFKKE
jgi:hypothetical protein